MESSDLPATSAERLNRREFLNYIWAASAALLLAEAGVGVAAYVIWQPLRKTLLHIDLSVLKDATDTNPVYQEPRLWLSNTPSGFFALNDSCTHQGCLLKWILVDNLFECPCHGATYHLNGTLGRQTGPARRNMDSFQVTVRTPDGTRTTPPGGGPVDIAGAIAIDVDLEAPIEGLPIGYSASGKPPTQSE